MSTHLIFGMVAVHIPVPQAMRGHHKRFWDSDCGQTVLFHDGGDNNLITESGAIARDWYPACQTEAEACDIAKGFSGGSIRFSNSRRGRPDTYLRAAISEMRAPRLQWSAEEQRIVVNSRVEGDGEKWRLDKTARVLNLGSWTPGICIGEYHKKQKELRRFSLYEGLQQYCTPLPETPAYFNRHSYLDENVTRLFVPVDFNNPLHLHWWFGQCSYANAAAPKATTRALFSKGEAFVATK